MSDVLTEAITEATHRASLDPVTGERFTLDDIINRNVVRHEGPVKRERELVMGARGRELEVPLECPVPGRLIQSTWCDWADGWYITLVNDVVLREQPGPDAPHVKSSEGRGYLQPGWHAYPGGTTNRDLIVSSFAAQSTGYPEPAVLGALWREYRRHLKAEGTCVMCLGSKHVRVNHGDQYACPECHPCPAVEKWTVTVPMVGGRPKSAAVTDTWWRYHGQDLMVLRPRIGVLGDPRDPRCLWVLLGKPSPDERASRLGSDFVWEDDKHRWVEGRRVFDVYRRVWSLRWPHVVGIAAIVAYGVGAWLML